MSKFIINVIPDGGDNENQKQQLIIFQRGEVIRNIEKAEGIHIGDVIHQKNDSSPSVNNQLDDTSIEDDEDYKKWKQQLREHIAKQDPEKMRKLKWW